MWIYRVFPGGAWLFITSPACKLAFLDLGERVWTLTAILFQDNTHSDVAVLKLGGCIRGSFTACLVIVCFP